MASQVKIANLQDERVVQAQIDEAIEKGWTRVHIGQPVHWPEVHRFLDAAQGSYLTVSRINETPEVSTDRQWTQWKYRQNYWFSDPNTAFDFKLRYG
jgi:hypothetical protein